MCSNLKLKFIHSFIFSLSLSTLSVSSGSVSSRGSLGSLASLGSTGSLASLSLTDIYMQGIGYQVTNTSLHDLYRRVENLLQGHSSSISPSSSVSASSQQGINALTGSGNHPLPVTSSASTSGAHSQSSLDNVGSNASSNTQLNKAMGGSLENMAELNAALSSSPYLRRVVDHPHPHPHPHLPTSSGASPVPSPPISPHGLAPPPPPPSYEQHVRQRLMGEEQTPPTPTGHGLITNDNQYHPPHAHQNAHALLINRPFTGTNNSGFGGIVPHTAHRGQHQQPPQPQQYHHHHTPLTENMDALLTGGGVCKRTLHDTAAETPLGSNPPLSPISESSSGVCNNLSGGNTRSVSAAVSDESVAGDSGVFEVSIKK